MKAVIYHNPACGTSRKTLTLLEETPNIEIEIVEYLKNPPTRAELAAMYARAGMTPRQGLRTRHEPAATLVAKLGLASASDDEILDAMVAYPALIERPLVETDKGVRLCRPQDVVREIL